MTAATGDGSDPFGFARPRNRETTAVPVVHDTGPSPNAVADCSMSFDPKSLRTARIDDGVSPGVQDF